MDDGNTRRRGKPGLLARHVPALSWLRGYSRTDAAGDTIAGMIVAVMLVPQAMAYAMLAGLPPQAGLYASILPLLLYALLGTSSTLAVGPVAVVSLLVADALGKLGASSDAELMGFAALLALAVGVTQLLMGVLRAGFLVNFLSQPVVSGFTSAAALVIAIGQAKHLLGISVPSGHAPYETVVGTVKRLGESHAMTMVVGSAAIVVLLFFQRPLGPWLERRGAPTLLSSLLPRMGALMIVVVGPLAAWAWSLPDAGLSIVGSIPAGLPQFAFPALDIGALEIMLPTVLAISFVGFLESFAVAQSLASKRRERVEGSQELVALGAANLGAALSGGYPVTGGFSRSLINFKAGARTGMASMVTAALVALTLAGLTPLLFYLPRAVLAAIIVVAVSSLVDLRSATRAWRYDPADGLALTTTFLGVFALGIEAGILVGAGLSLVLYLWRTSRPHMAVVGQVGSSEHYRNIDRHRVTTDPHVLAIRIDENLYFANVRYLEERVQQLVADNPDVRHVLLICSGINFIDTTGLDCLEHCAEGLRETGASLHLAEVKGPVMDRLRNDRFARSLGEDHFHLSTHEAMHALRVSGDKP